jgi:hypothetical protein
VSSRTCRLERSACCTTRLVFLLHAHLITPEFSAQLVNAFPVLDKCQGDWAFEYIIEETFGSMREEERHDRLEQERRDRIEGEVA